jgi:hypothetical protein
MATLFVEHGPQPFEGLGEGFAVLDFDPDTHVARLDGRREAGEFDAR